ncbi:TRAF-like family protein [Dorcoceras hygrometricum]|uniref:TRAF-like family protein n=1 Tax=Dorcoceras hygrometricum TaxID=472368 RepID=A0A2Z6ZZY0_9LAMI|nr:TRAF-like family protein [Dorcoceras hygrometricum]
MLNTLSRVSVWESRIQYLCDPQWFRDTASRGPTTIVAPKSQFRTCPADHDSIGYPRMSASGESSTMMHQLLHASGSHPIPTPHDPKYFIEEQSADVVVSTSEYRFEFQRVFAKKSKRQRFDKLERRHGVHSFVSADEVISRSFLEEVQQLVKYICWRLRYDSVWLSWNDSVLIGSAEAFL